MCDPTTFNQEDINKLRNLLFLILVEIRSRSDHVYPILAQDRVSDQWFYMNCSFVWLTLAAAMADAVSAGAEAGLA